MIPPPTVHGLLPVVPQCRLGPTLSTRSGLDLEQEADAYLVMPLVTLQRLNLPGVKELICEATRRLLLAQPFPFGPKPFKK